MHSYDPCKHLRWRALQQKSTAQSRWLFVEVLAYASNTLNISRKDIKNISQNILNNLTKFLVLNYWWYKSSQIFSTTYENTPNDFSFWKRSIKKKNKKTKYIIISVHGARKHLKNKKSILLKEKKQRLQSQDKTEATFWQNIIF